MIIKNHSRQEDGMLGFRKAGNNSEGTKVNVNDRSENPN